MTPDPDPLEPLLDAAGRAVQPTDPAWDHLPQRLTQTPQPRRRRRLWWLAPPLAAAAAAALFVALWLGPSPSVNAEQPAIEVKRLDVDLTVLSASDKDADTLYMPLLRLGPFAVGGAPVLPRGTGQALVKDHRLILNLQKGDNVVRFGDVAATIDPTSVRFVSTTDPVGTQVIEQNFEYDLVNADALLKRYLDEEITCVGRDGAATGFLVAHDPDNIVLASAPPDPARQKPRQTQVLPRRTLQAVRLKDVPTDLLVKPTLVWKLRAEKPGKHDTTVSYLCGFVKWSADYVALVTPGAPGQPDLLDLTGWVTLDNASGTTYDKAGLKLIAGDVNRVRDPWAQLLVSLDDFKERDEKMTADSPLPTSGALPPKEFVEKSFFEYHLYTLTAPSTVRDKEVKQLTLLKRSGIKAERRYVYDPQADGSRNLAVELIAKNEKDNHLGVPLPKGRVAFEEIDTDGESALTGRTDIDHTAVKEELTLRHGHAFDVVGEIKLLDRTHFEMRIRNHKMAQTIGVRAVARIAAQRKITQASHAFVMHDVGTAHFDFAVPPNAEVVVKYTVEEK